MLTDTQQSSQISKPIKYQCNTNFLPRFSSIHPPSFHLSISEELDLASVMPCAS